MNFCVILDEEMDDFDGNEMKEIYRFVNVIGTISL